MHNGRAFLDWYPPTALKRTCPITAPNRGAVRLVIMTYVADDYFDKPTASSRKDVNQVCAPQIMNQNMQSDNIMQI